MNEEWQHNPLVMLVATLVWMMDHLWIAGIALVVTWIAWRIWCNSIT